MLGRQRRGLLDERPPKRIIEAALDGSAVLDMIEEFVSLDQDG